MILIKHDLLYSPLKDASRIVSIVLCFLCKTFLFRPFGTTLAVARCNYSLRMLPTFNDRLNTNYFHVDLLHFCPLIIGRASIYAHYQFHTHYTVLTMDHCYNNIARVLRVRKSISIKDIWNYKDRILFGIIRFS